MSWLHAMVGAILPRSTRDRHEYMNACEVVVKTQLTLARVDIDNAAKSLWVAGYLFGAHTGLLQLRGIERGPKAVKYLRASYRMLFDDVLFGLHVLEQSFQPQVQSHSEFGAGMQTGGEDVVNWAKTELPPMRLMARLTDSARQPGN